ncbi:MAG: polysaccharide biosynthesis protein [Candidatus Omnitrophica bacterium]|nr:polysaccharide biosynthesis protein [Candidatus Omnitrophota bacterium]
MKTKYRKLIMVAIDVLLINISIFLAFMIRFDWNPSSLMREACVYFMVLASVIRVSMFFVFGAYQWSFRHASMSEAMNIFKAVTVGTLVIITAAFFMRHDGMLGMGRTVLLIDYLICFFLISASRFLPRFLMKFRTLQRSNLKRVLIVGAGTAGEMVVRELLNVQNGLYRPVGFVDDDHLKLHSRIHGIRILGMTDDIKKLVTEYEIEEIVIAIPSANGRAIRNIVSKCENLGVKIKIIPGLHKIMTGEVSIKQITDVQPEDLLGRQMVEMNAEDVRAFLKGQVVLVTGAGGSIGSELCRQIIKFEPSLLLLFDYNENDIFFLELDLKEKYPYLNLKTIIGDIKDVGLLKHTFSKYKPDIVFHSAAHKHVPLMEENPVAAVKNNIIGTRNFMYASEHYGVKSFVMISTDKAVNPTSIMGASKRIAETMIQAKAQSAKTKFMAVRFGNVIGSSGSVVPIFKKQIEKGGPITVTHPDVKRFFMLASEAAQLVIQAGAIGNGGEIFILDMGEQIKISDLAKNLITLSGLEVDVDIEVKYIGLRPGEKMEEETLLDIEHDKATKYNKVFIAQPNNFDPKKVRRDIKALERMANVMDGPRIVEKMKKMVPFHNPNTARK